MQGKQCFDQCARTFYISEGECASSACSPFDPAAIVIEFLFWTVVFWAAGVMLYACCKALGRYLSKIEEEFAEEQKHKETNNKSNTDIMSS